MFHGRTITGEIRINAQESGEENPKKEEEFLFESSEEDHRQEENHIFKPDVSTHHHNGHGSFYFESACPGIDSASTSGNGGKTTLPSSSTMSMAALAIS